MALYEALLDDLDDDHAHADDVVDLAEKPGLDDDDVVDDELDVPDLAADVELSLEAKADELLAEVEDSESWSDDPVRMYLTLCCSANLYIVAKKA